jgi:hypothetical protein
VHIPYSIPDYPWQVFHMDFKTGLPRTARGNDSFVLMICRLTKRMHVLPCKKTISTIQTGDLMFNEIIRHHGFSEKIITDRDPRFTSQFWTELWNHLYTKLNLSTARHPQTDSQAERGIRTIVEMIRAFCSDNPTSWDKLLGAFEFAYNDSIHPMTGYTPFQLDIGRNPHTPISLMIKRFARNAEIDSPLQHVKDYSKVIEEVKAKLQKFSEKQAAILRGRASPAYFFEPGDYVLIENPKVNDIRTLPALDDRFIGPYKVLEVVGPNIYKLDFVSELDLRVLHRHPVVSGDKLKPYTFRRLDVPLMDTESNEEESGPSAVITLPTLATEVNLPSSPIIVPQEESSVIQLPPAIIQLPPATDMEVITLPSTKKKVALITFHSIHTTQEENITTCKVMVVIPDSQESISLVDVCEEHLRGRTKPKRKQLFSLLKTQLATTTITGRPSWAKHVGEVLILKLSGRRISALVAAVDELNNVYVLWSDGDARGYSSEEWMQMSTQTVNALTIENLNETVWDVTQPEQLLQLISTLLPGAWKIGHATNLCNKMLGGNKFNPMFVQTDDGEVSALTKHLRIEHLKSKMGLDPCAGKRTIPRMFLQELKIRIKSNELNSLFPSHYHFDALNPANYIKSKLGQFDYVVTSIPFIFADVLIPLFTLTYEACFLHLPSWYAFQGSRFRTQWLQQLVAERRIIVMNVCAARNKTFGKFAVWVCIFKTRDLMFQYIKNANELFQNSMPCFMGP